MSTSLEHNARTRRTRRHQSDEEEAAAPFDESRDKLKNGCWRRYYKSKRPQGILLVILFSCLMLYNLYLWKGAQNNDRTIIVPYSIEGDAVLQDLNGWHVKVEEPSYTNNKWVHTWFDKKAEWKWYCYSSLYQNQSTPRILLAQYMGFVDPNGHYSSLLRYTSPVNMAYAKKWGMDYVTLTGLALNDDHVIPPNYFLTRHSSFNKIILLERALQLSKHYDWLWILDSDALMYNFTMSPSYILPDTNDTFLMAHRVKYDDSIHTHNINNGVTFWNLHHKTTFQILEEWRRISVNRIAANAQLQTRGSLHVVEGGDQVILHRCIMYLPEQERQGVYAVEWLQDTFIKHVVRDDHRQWTPGNYSKARQDLLKSFAFDTCRRFAPACNGIMRDDFLTAGGGAIEQSVVSDTVCVS